MKYASIVLALSLVTFAGTASASEKGDGKCEHKRGNVMQRFDKNNDGALTKDEVGEKKWARIGKADANNDGKVTKAELDAARAAHKRSK